MEPILSVVIPVYNCEKYVERAAKSVLEQPCAEHIELLIVDDGSKDGSAKILECIADEHENVRTFHKENGGASSARNLGIEKATGKYIAFLDADDWWEPNFFDEEIFGELNREDYIDIFLFSHKKASIDMKYEFVQNFEEGEWRRKSIADTNYFNFIWTSPCCYVHRLEHIRNNNLRYLSTKCYEDIPFAEMSVLLSCSVKVINKPIFSYWENINSCVHTTKTQNKFEETYKALNYQRQLLAKKGFNYDVDRQALSMLISLLPDFCAYNSYRFVRDYISSEQCEIIRKDLEPWQYLKKTQKAWEKHPRLFWIKCKIYPGIGYAVKRFCYKIKWLRLPANHFYHKYITKWQRVK